MRELPAPSPELAAKVLREVGYEERLVGQEMSPATGNARRSLYSLQEAVNFLQMGSASDLLMRGGQMSIGYVDLPELVAWLGEALADRELAAAVKEAVAQGVSYQEQLLAAKELMRQRLSQCKAVAEPVTEV